MTRKLLSWTLYWLGDVCWRVFDRDPHGMTGWQYRLYHQLMQLAFQVQGEGDGPWRKAMAPTGQDETLAQPLGRSHDS